MNKIPDKIGIMQGRLLPPSQNKLQLFPSRWQKELPLVREAGFKLIELLDDKKNKLRKLLSSKTEDIFSQISLNGLKCQSVCADYLSGCSLLKNETLFLNKLEELLNRLKEKKDFIFVIPFFDENKLGNRGQLALALQKLSRYDDFLREKKLFFSLEIDLPAKMIKQEFQKLLSKNIGICYDFGNNLNQGYDLSGDIRLLKKYINHIHIKDKKNNENIRIRKGLEQFKRALYALKEIGFGGLMILETCPFPDALREAKMNINTLEEYLGKINN